MTHVRLVRLAASVTVALCFKKWQQGGEILSNFPYSGQTQAVLAESPDQNYLDFKNNLIKITTNFVEIK